MKMHFVSVTLAIVCAVGVGCSGAAATQLEPPDGSNTTNGARKMVRVQLNSPEGFVQGDVYFEQIAVTQPNGKTGSALLFWFYVPETGSLWYEGAIKGYEEDWIEKLNEFWVVPKVGIVNIRAQDQRLSIQVSKEHAKDLATAREIAVRSAKNCFDSPTRPRSCHQAVQFDVEPYFGVGFSRRKDDAAPPPPSKVKSVRFTDERWTIQIESRISGELAGVELDDSFRLVRITKAGKRVYPQIKD